MGFLESLKQQKETELLTKQQCEVEQVRLREAQEAARKEKEARDRELHNLKREEAIRYRNESGIETLVSKFRSIIGIFKDLQGYSTIRELDSVLDIAVWDPTFIGKVWETRGVFEPTSHLVGERFRAKCICVETTPDGKIIFHNAGFLGDIRISVSEWKRNPEVLEASLEKAFRHPITFTGIKPETNPYNPYSS